MMTNSIHIVVKKLVEAWNRHLARNEYKHQIIMLG
jgi:hypothetical protein